MNHGYKTLEKEEFNIWCSSKTCKTKCYRNIKYKKDDKIPSYMSFERVCKNYWNGINWDKPKGKERIINKTEPGMFIVKEIKC